jgi:hypothetical protein
MRAQVEDQQSEHAAQAAALQGLSKDRSRLDAALTYIQVPTTPLGLHALGVQRPDQIGQGLATRLRADPECRP